MKYIGVDYGSKKCGLAVSDNGGQIAVPLAIVPTENLAEELDKMLENVLFERIVFGESVNSKGEHNAVWDETKKFINDLKSRHEQRFANGELEVKIEKEFLTSKHARYLDNEKDVDDRAAALILQRFLDKANNEARQIAEKKYQEESGISDDEDL